MKCLKTGRNYINSQCVPLVTETYTARWAGRGSWSRSAGQGDGPHRSVRGPGCGVWAARCSAPVCWLCRWHRQTAVPPTDRTGWTPRTPRRGAGLAQRCRWPPQCRCHHRSGQLSQRKRRPLAPLVNKWRGQLNSKKTTPEGCCYNTFITFIITELAWFPAFCYSHGVFGRNGLVGWMQTQALCVVTTPSSNEKWVISSVKLKTQPLNLLLLTKWTNDSNRGA